MVSKPLPPTFLTAALSPFTQDATDSPSVSVYTGDDSARIPTPLSPDPARPYVTLTFAQSIDAKIAGKGGLQLALSGKESLVMTHWLRTMHDAIMVGIGTALNDNPQLNTRHLPPLSLGSGQRYHLPRPIILDSKLRLRLNCKLLNNYREGTGRRPWVIGSQPEVEGERAEWTSRKENLERAGARVIEVPGANGRVSVPGLLSTLRGLGIRSLMVEGGASVIKSFLASAPGEWCVDTVIVTVAPVFVGADGVGYGEDLTGSEVPKLKHVRTELFGRDAVMALKAL